MDTNMISMDAPMKYKVVKRTQLELMRPGPRSELADLLERLQKLKPDSAVLIETQANQRQVYNRMRSNISKWKRRNGLRHIEVHLTEDGNVALYRPKK